MYWFTDSTNTFSNFFEIKVFLEQAITTENTSVTKSMLTFDTVDREALKTIRKELMDQTSLKSLFSLLNNLTVRFRAVEP